MHYVILTLITIYHYTKIFLHMYLMVFGYTFLNLFNFLLPINKQYNYVPTKYMTLKIFAFEFKFKHIWYLQNVNRGKQLKLVNITLKFNYIREVSVFHAF